MKLRLAILWGLVLCALVVYQPQDPLAVAPSAQFRGPSLAHWLGTDRLGRDVFSRVGSATRRTLVQAGCAEVAGFGMALGVALGVAVLGRRWRVLAVTVDTLVMALRTLPPFLVALALAVFLRGPGMGLVVALLALSFLYSEPVYEAEIRQALKHPAVEGAISLGASPIQIARRNLAPMLGRRLVSYAILDFASLVAFAALFSFVGLTSPPNPSLGEMLYEARPYLAAHPWLFCGPGVALAFMLVGFWLLKPEMIKER